MAQELGIFRFTLEEAQGHHRHGGSVRGLTTVAAIWVAAALGVAAGADLYVLALGGAVLASLVLEYLAREPGDELEYEGAVSAAKKAHGTLCRLRAFT